jgi:hypothetical protein
MTAQLSRNFIVNYIIGLSIVIPMYRLASYWFEYSLNIFAIILLILALIINLDKVGLSKFNQVLFFRSIVFILFSAFIYSKNSSSYYVYLYGFATLTIILLGSNNTFFVFKRIFLSAVILALISHVVYIMGFDIVTGVFILDGQKFFMHGLTLHQYYQFNWLDLSTYRFYGFTDEPGQMATLLFFILLADNFKKTTENYILLLGAMATFSTSFFMLLAIYLSIQRFKFLIYVLVFFVILYLLKDYFNNFLLFDLFYEKVFYIFEHNDSFIDRFAKSMEAVLLGNFSIFGDISKASEMDSGMFSIFIYAGVVGFIIYLLSIMCMPKKYWIFFIAVGFYRYHFIFNSIALMMLFMHHDWTLSNQSDKRGMACKV